MLQSLEIGLHIIDGKEGLVHQGLHFLPGGITMRLPLSSSHGFCMFPPSQNSALQLHGCDLDLTVIWDHSIVKDLLVGFDPHNEVISMKATVIFEDLNLEVENVTLALLPSWSTVIISIASPMEETVVFSI
ncbi:hypothetical protein MRB53_006217 [Persea americana]|uniref:Uncharacterized protein n=1 Tax=Persea americana TaxID=3435 RepID=A0ACC2MFI6_PERAE|nr:hypothetical protein MRB53_006217 [Persea americana]